MWLPLQTCLYATTAAAVDQSRPLHEPCSVDHFPPFYLRQKVSCSFVPPLAPDPGDATVRRDILVEIESLMATNLARQRQHTQRPPRFGRQRWLFVWRRDGRSQRRRCKPGADCWHEDRLPVARRAACRSTPLAGRRPSRRSQAACRWHQMRLHVGLQPPANQTIQRSYRLTK